MKKWLLLLITLAAALPGAQAQGGRGFWHQEWCVEKGEPRTQPVPDYGADRHKPAHGRGARKGGRDAVACWPAGNRAARRSLRWRPKPSRGSKGGSTPCRLPYRRSTSLRFPAAMPSFRCAMSAARFAAAPNAPHCAPTRNTARMPRR